MRLYGILAALLALWALVLLALNLTLGLDTYSYSYYSIDYTFGFVRRGLAGELVKLLPGDNAFIHQRIGRWISSGVFFFALGVLAWWIAASSGRSERRKQLALLLTVLPFGYSFGLLSAGSTLYGGAALIMFGVAVARAGSANSVLIASTIFGLATALLALIHEAIPFLIGLGVITVISTLANQMGRIKFWFCCALALGPGLAMAAVIAVFGVHGVADQLCTLMPHAQINNPLAGNPSFMDLLAGYRHYDDYHDWACRNITPLYNKGIVDGMRFVGLLGPAGMIINTVYGLGLVILTAVSIGFVSGVPPQRIWMLLRQRPIALAIGLGLMVPIFLTGIDWVRWWVSISLDIGLGYLLYASRQPEIDALPTRCSMRVFIVLLITLALVPIGIVPAFFAPLAL